jgi:hypothetical protein
MQALRGPNPRTRKACAADSRPMPPRQMSRLVFQQLPASASGLASWRRDCTTKGKSKSSTAMKKETQMNPIHRSHIAAALLLAALLLALNAPAMAQYGTPGAGFGVSTPALQPVTAEEAKSLQFMREEEKLARDVYKVLLDKWNLVVFQNIAKSEETHFAAIGTLLIRYGVADPAQAAAGVYQDPALNSLYNQLVAKGLQSAQDALEVGVIIEKKDIADLESALKGTDKFDIKRVFNNLMNGSYQHLDAFETVCTIITPAN